MEMTTVLNGLVVGKLSGLNTPAALRAGAVGAAIGGNPQTSTILTVLFARREKARQARFADKLPELVVEAEEEKAQEGEAQKLDARVAAVEKSARASQAAIAKVEKSLATVESSLEQTGKKVEEIANAVGSNTSPTQAQSSARKSK